MTTLDPISIATKGYQCGTGPSGIPIATMGYVCIAATFQQAIAGIISMVGSLGAVFIEASGADDNQKNGGVSIGIDIGLN